MDEIHVHKTKKSICAHFAESPCNTEVYSKLTHTLVDPFFIYFLQPLNSNEFLSTFLPYIEQKVALNTLTDFFAT